MSTRIHKSTKSFRTVRVNVTTPAVERQEQPVKKKKTNEPAE